MCFVSQKYEKILAWSVIKPAGVATFAKATEACRHNHAQQPKLDLHCRHNPASTGGTNSFLSATVDAAVRDAAVRPTANSYRKFQGPVFTQPSTVFGDHKQLNTFSSDRVNPWLRPDIAALLQSSQDGTTNNSAAQLTPSRSASADTAQSFKATATVGVIALLGAIALVFVATSAGSDFGWTAFQTINDVKRTLKKVLAEDESNPEELQCITCICTYLKKATKKRLLAFLFGEALHMTPKKQQEKVSCMLSVQEAEGIGNASKRAHIVVKLSVTGISVALSITVS